MTLFQWIILQLWNFWVTPTSLPFRITNHPFWTPNASWAQTAEEEALRCSQSLRQYILSEPYSYEWHVEVPSVCLSCVVSSVRAKIQILYYSILNVLNEFSKPWNPQPCSCTLFQVSWLGKSLPSFYDTNRGTTLCQGVREGARGDNLHRDTRLGQRWLFRPIQILRSSMKHLQSLSLSLLSLCRSLSLCLFLFLCVSSSFCVSRSYLSWKITLPTNVFMHLISVYVQMDVLETAGLLELTKGVSQSQIWWKLLIRPSVIYEPAGVKLFAQTLQPLLW